jgi:hypothetical protein
MKLATAIAKLLKKEKKYMKAYHSGEWIATKWIPFEYSIVNENNDIFIIRECRHQRSKKVLYREEFHTKTPVFSMQDLIENWIIYD